MERIGNNIKRFYNCVSLYSLSCNVVIGQEDSTTLYNSMSTKREIERAIILMKL